MKREEIQKGLLPSGYRQLEYIESTGNQYINTGILSGNATEVIADVQITYITNQARFLGSDNGYFEMYIGTGAAWFSAAMGGTTYKCFNVNLNRHIHSLSNVTNQYRLDNSSYSVRHNSASYQGSELTLFARKTALDQTYCHAKLFSAQFYESSVSTRDFIPALRISDSKPGLYDLCGSISPLTNSPFYTNEGTGEFLYA